MADCCICAAMHAAALSCTHAGPHLQCPKHANWLISSHPLGESIGRDGIITMFAAGGQGNASAPKGDAGSAAHWVGSLSTALGLVQKDLQRVRDLHRKVTRYGLEDFSISAEAYEVAEYEDAGYSRDEFEPFDICEECGRLEMAADQRGDEGGTLYKESVWPCATINALGGE